MKIKGYTLASIPSDFCLIGILAYFKAHVVYVGSFEAFKVHILVLACDSVEKA